MSDVNPTLGPIRKERGVAGQVSYSVQVTYPGEDAHTARFVGSVYGGPVVLVMPSGSQVFVSDPARFGEFGPDWVRRFFEGRA